MGKKSLRPSISDLSGILIFALVLFSCTPVRKHEGHFFAFDTSIDVTVYSRSGRADADIDSLQTVFTRIEDKLSISRPDGEICRINNRLDSTVVVSDTLKSILKICRSEFARSNGLFDVTVEPLKFLYGLESHQTAGHVPSWEQLDSAMMRIGFNRIRFVSDSVFVMPSGMHLDFGGIAKGYVLIAAQRFLLSKGYTSFLVNAGGDLVAQGVKPSKIPWNIGIQNPRVKDNLVATLAVSDRCVFTSGDYERCFVRDGRRYHHLFDPRTGVPGSFNRSATVVGTDPLATDAVVKTAFLMPAPQALEYLASRNMPGLLIDSAGAGWASASMKPFLKADSVFTVTYR
jgi:thiamine biosynthesis lipoprotein